VPAAFGKVCLTGTVAGPPWQLGSEKAYENASSNEVRDDPQEAAVPAVRRETQ
jgi:hypothetical protein